MNKRRFGRISLLVSASLAVLVAVQVWSLVNMYHARREEFSRQVMQAMTRAAYDDLLLGNKPSGQKSHITFSSSGNIDSIQVDMIQEITVKNLSGAGKSITFTPKSDTIHHDISVSNGGTTRLIRQEIRIPSVYVLRLNMARYDSLLTCNLAAAGIDLPHKVDVVRGPTDSTSSARLFTTKPLTEPEVVLTPLNDSLRLRDPLTFTTSLTTDKELYFRLRIENPDRQLLGEMAGVVVSSLLMLAVVAGALLYLLRTLFRQKTLEEMRRDLTHNITHELKTPIAVANAANDALLDFGAADDVQRRRRYLTVIRQQLASLSDMVQRILTMSVEERGEFGLVREETDVGALLREVADEYRLKARKEARIELRVEPDPLLFPLDRFHMRHLAGNLVDNALKYSGERVHIRIEARLVQGWLQLTVDDDGIGIDRRAREHIFEKFYRVPTGDRQEVRGFGLGLYYVRLVALRHGGTIRVDSAPGRGTRFTIRIPNHDPRF
ncbi:HAMP domain-containing sensor histidine kinase [uncultured Alistipes sp.]|uniref:sensor histidine kinase n=1 Tax=uncultured Alistipes sp. TaxID=538949 RepID=UPI0028058E5C|nr:HAMP domain-containing sensor histidine kinase [uncultured Alistipes sp.]